MSSNPCLLPASLGLVIAVVPDDRIMLLLMEIRRPNVLDIIIIELWRSDHQSEYGSRLHQPPTSLCSKGLNHG